MDTEAILSRPISPAQIRTLIIDRASAMAIERGASELPAAILELMRWLKHPVAGLHHKMLGALETHWIAEEMAACRWPAAAEKDLFAAFARR